MLDRITLQLLVISTVTTTVSSLDASGSSSDSDAADDDSDDAECHVCFGGDLAVLSAEDEEKLAQLPSW